MNLWTGTSGYSYKEWKGSFYPEDLPNAGMLEYYSGRLPAVEINNTFYRLPKAEVLESWADQVGGDFRFVLKASRRITHFKRLQNAEDETEYMLRTAGVLGERLGAVLFQLPPNFKKDIERLNAFVELIGDPGRAAFEFRHSSWFDEETYECLRSRGAALCIADTDDQDGEPVATAEWGYLRLRKADYSDEALEAWATRIRDQEWERAYVFFKHEEGGVGPEMAERFMGLF